MIANRDLKYIEKDKEKVSKYAAIYSVMCEESRVIVGDDTIKYGIVNLKYTVDY